MGKEIEILQHMIDESSKIVFFGGAGFLQKAEFQIFAALMDFITRNMTIRQRQF